MLIPPVWRGGHEGIVLIEGIVLVLRAGMRLEQAPLSIASKCTTLKHSSTALVAKLDGSIKSSYVYCYRSAASQNFYNLQGNCEAAQ